MATQKNPFSLEKIRDRQETEAYMDKLRKAAFESVQESDVQEIMRALLERAKKAEPRAVQMVMDQLLGMKKQGGDSYSQTNIYEAPEPRKKKKSLPAPGTPEAIADLRRKANRGEELFGAANGHGSGAARRPGASVRVARTGDQPTSAVALAGND